LPLCTGEEHKQGDKTMQPRILLVEDDPAHARLIEKNLRRAAITNEIIIVDNGQKALDYLKYNCQKGSAGPLVIFLDLNLPILDGYQVLAKIKSDEQTKKIMVIILTTSDIPQEIERCYELGCNLYISKSVQYEEFCTAVRNIGLLLSTVKIP
jgi:CheY-like chemotaxis protein